MKNLKNKIKNVKGITLISLVITIIVLIILAGVTLNMLLGENGIINRTKTARDENEKATATETINLKITNVQISKYAEEQRMPTLKELADNFCEDDDFQYVQETSEVASLTKITSNNPTSIYTKLKAYPYEFEINNSLQLASIDGVKVATVPANDNDTIATMTKSELDTYINTALQSIKDDYEDMELIPITYTSPSTNATWTKVANYPEGFTLNNCDLISGYLWHNNINKYSIPCANGDTWQVLVRMTSDGIEMYVNNNNDFLGKQGVLYLKKN